MHVDIKFSQHYSFLREWPWHPSQKLFNHICEGLFLHSIPLVCMSVCMPVPHSFDYCSFVVSFESEVWDLQVCCPFSRLFGCLGSILSFTVTCIVIFTSAISSCGFKFLPSILYHRLGDYRWVGLSLGFLSYSIGLYVCLYASTTQFWLL